MGGGGGGGGRGRGRRRKKYFSFFHQETCLFPSYLTYTESCTFAACPSPALSMLSMDDPDGPMDCSGADWEPVATPLLVLVPQRSLRTLSLLRDLGVLVPQHVSWKQSLFLFRHRSRHSSSSFSDIWSKTHTHTKSWIEMQLTFYPGQTQPTLERNLASAESVLKIFWKCYGGSL